MRLLTLVLTALSLTVSFVSVTAASLRETCGDGKVLSVSTLPFDAGEITVTEIECPGFAARVEVEGRADSEPEHELGKRDTSQCTNDACNVYCQSTGNQPFISDCDTLTDALEKNYPNMFLVNPNTMVKFNHTTCAYGFANLDTVPYDVCYLNFGYNGAITAEDCFGDYPAPKATPGGFCLDPNSKWGIEVFNPEGQVE